MIPTKRQVKKALRELIQKYQEGIKYGIVQTDDCAVCDLFLLCGDCVIGPNCIKRPSFLYIQLCQKEYLKLSSEENRLNLKDAYGVRINELKIQLKNR